MSKFVKEEVTFVVTFKHSKKVIPCANYNFAKIYDKVKEKFQTFPNFPKIFRVKYEDKDVETMIDSDSPIQLVNRSSNIPIMMEETPDSDV